MCKESAEWPVSLGMTARAEHSTIPMVRREDAIFTYRLDVTEPYAQARGTFCLQDSVHSI